jgi:hypothetical protein
LSGTFSYEPDWIRNAGQCLLKRKCKNRSKTRREIAALSLILDQVVGGQSSMYRKHKA